MAGLLIRDFNSATSVHYHSGLPYDDDGALLVSQGYCVGQNYAGWSRTSVNADVGAADDNEYVTLTSLTLPGGLMGANSKLLIVTDWDFPGSAGNKIPGVDIGGQNIGLPTITTSRAFKWMAEFQNINSLTAQKTSNNSQYGATANVRIDTTVNTASDATIAFKFRWSVATVAETVTLIGYSIWHYPGA